MRAHGAIFEQEVEMFKAGAREDGLVVIWLVQSYNSVDGEASEDVDVTCEVRNQIYKLYIYKLSM